MAFKVTMRNLQFLLILAVVTQASTVVMIFASSCQAGRTQHNTDNMCFYFGSE